jgi:hypothetical protein
MHNKIKLMWILILLALVACKQQAQPLNGEKAVEQSPSETKQEAVEQAKQTAIALPDARKALEDIYSEPVATGDEPIQLTKGRYVSFWGGHQFDVDGATYYLGLSEATDESEVEYPTEADQVNIFQVMYELVDGQWQIVGKPQQIGKFGSHTKPPVIDAAKSTLAFKDVPGKVILAMPTVISAMAGTQISFYEIFGYSIQDKAWKHLGSVKAGSDNSAGCARDQESKSPIQCATSTASLKFSAADNSYWPELKVAMQGTAANAEGKVVALSEKDVLLYRVDSKTSVYQQVQ